jgi:hypothetical protein
VNGQANTKRKTTHSTSPSQYEEAGLVLAKVDKRKIQTYLHYCRFWDVNVRNELTVVFHEYFKRFHVAEKHKIMTAAIKRYMVLQLGRHQRYTRLKSF